MLKLQQSEKFLESGETLSMKMMYEGENPFPLGLLTCTKEDGL